MADAIPGTPPHTMFWLAQFYNRLLVLPNADSGLAPICCMTESNENGVNKDPDFRLALFTDMAGIEYPARKFSEEALDQSAIRFNELIEEAIRQNLLPTDYDVRLQRGQVISHKRYGELAGRALYDESGQYKQANFSKNETYTGEFAERLHQVNDEEIAADPISRKGVRINIDFTDGEWPFGKCIFSMIDVKGVTEQNVNDVIFALVRITQKTSERENEIAPPGVESPRIVLWPKIKSDFQPQLKPVIKTGGPKTDVSPA